ncbi:MAG: NTP transferase domain-containing protein [Oscillospiraceae bacterium]|nr:NTP transferase domain-containing protein [Oscillospiraceae bacterium]
MEKPVLVVLAAGMGSRYGGLKQMDSVGSCGQCLIDYSIYDARRAGFEKVIFVINRELEADFRALVGSRISRGMEVRYAFQEMEDMVGDVPIPPSRTKPWGTTHAVLAARELIDGPFAVINADDYYGPEAYRVLYDYLAHHTDRPDCFQYAMVGYYLGKTLSDNGGVTRGVCRINRDGLLESIVEQQNIEREGEGGRFTTDDGQNWNHLSGETLVSMNFWGFQRSFLEEARERFPLLLRRALGHHPEKGEVQLPVMVADMLDRGRAQVRVLSSGEKWFGVTYREDKPKVVEALRKKTEQGLYPEDLWA